jgi:hypothetical protein
MIVKFFSEGWEMGEATCSDWAEVRAACRAWWGQSHEARVEARGGIGAEFAVRDCPEADPRPMGLPEKISAKEARALGYAEVPLWGRLLRGGVPVAALSAGHLSVWLTDDPVVRAEAEAVLRGAAADRVSAQLRVPDGAIGEWESDRAHRMGED